MKNAESARRRSRKTSGRRLLQISPTSGRLVELASALDLRERMVEVLDSLDRDDVDTARFYAQGILDDLDAATTLAPIGAGE